MGADVASESVGEQWGALLPKISASPKGLVICQGISDSPTQKNLSFMRGGWKVQSAIVQNYRRGKVGSAVKLHALNSARGGWVARVQEGLL